MQTDFHKTAIFVDWYNIGCSLCLETKKRLQSKSFIYFFPSTLPNLFMKKIFLLSSLVLLIASCQKESVYNQYVDLEEGNWQLDSLINFEFEIKATSKPVDVFYNIRHDVSYPFYNLYTKYELTDPKGKIVRSNMHEAKLMDATTGVPNGTGESIFDNQILLLKDFKFPESGKYKFSIKQYMREQQLEGILAVGLTIREVEN